MASNMRLTQQLSLLRVFAVVFNLFALLFAVFMALDYLEHRLGFSELAFFIFPGTSLVLAFVSLMAGRAYKPDRLQPCPSCGEKIPFFLKWHCDSCNSDQKKERYIVEKCDTCKARLETFTCSECNAQFDPSAC